MLVIDVSVNGLVFIGEILIQRLTDKEDMPESGMCEYVIRKPEGPWNDKPFMHCYHFGWFPLLSRACKILEKEGYETPHQP